MFIRIIFVGSFKSHVYSNFKHFHSTSEFELISFFFLYTVISSKPIKLLIRSKIFWTISSYRCLRQPMTQRNIQNCIVSCNMSLVSIVLMMNQRQKVHYLTEMFRHPNNGPMKTIHHTHITFITCMQI